MSRPMTMQELREAMESKSQGGGSNRYLPLGKIPVEGHVAVRFIADADKTNPVRFYRDVFKHTLQINGRREDIICPKTIDDYNCPICAASSSFYDSGDKENGVKYWARRTQLFQLIVRDASYDVEELKGRVLILDAGTQINSKIKSGCDYELEYVPFDYEMGTDFNIRKTLLGKDNNYTTSGFARRESALTEAEIQVAEEGAIDLSSVYNDRIKSHAELQAIIESQLTGAPFENSAEESDDDDYTTMRERFQQKAGVTHPSPAASKDYDEDLPEAEVTQSAPAATEAPASSSGSSVDIGDILARVRGGQ